MWQQVLAKRRLNDIIESNLQRIMFSSFYDLRDKKQKRTHEFTHEHTKKGDNENIQSSISTANCFFF